MAGRDYAPAPTLRIGQMTAPRFTRTANADEDLSRPRSARGRPTLSHDSPGFQVFDLLCYLLESCEHIYYN